MNDRGQLAKELFARQAELICAKFGLDRPKATADEVKALEEAVTQAQQRCADAGISMPDALAADKEAAAAYTKSVQSITAYALAQAKVKALLPRRRRKAVSVGVSMLLGMGICAVARSGWSIPVALALSAIATLPLNMTLGRYFPTPGVRVGRMSAKLKVAPMKNMFPGDPDNQADYVATLLMELRRMARRGELPVWVNVR